MAGCLCPTSRHAWEIRCNVHLTSNDDRLEYCLLHRAAGNEVCIVQHISRQPLQLVPDKGAEGSHSMLEGIIGSIW